MSAAEDHAGRDVRRKALEGGETTDDTVQFMLSLLVSVTSRPTMATLCYLVHLFGFADFYRAISQTVIDLLYINMMLPFP